jgi:hypothetical protein
MKVLIKNMYFNKFVCLFVKKFARNHKIKTNFQNQNETIKIDEKTLSDKMESVDNKKSNKEIKSVANDKKNFLRDLESKPEENMLDKKMSEYIKKDNSKNFHNKNEDLSNKSNKYIQKSSKKVLNEDSKEKEDEEFEKFLKEKNLTYKSLEKMNKKELNKLLEEHYSQRDLDLEKENKIDDENLSLNIEKSDNEKTNEEFLNLNERPIMENKNQVEQLVDEIEKKSKGHIFKIKDREDIDEDTLDKINFISKNSNQVTNIVSMENFLKILLNLKITYLYKIQAIEFVERLVYKHNAPLTSISLSMKVISNMIKNDYEFVNQTDENELSKNRIKGIIQKVISSIQKLNLNSIKNSNSSDQIYFIALINYLSTTDFYVEVSEITLNHLIEISSEILDVISNQELIILFSSFSNFKRLNSMGFEIILSEIKLRLDTTIKRKSDNNNLKSSNIEKENDAEDNVNNEKVKDNKDTNKDNEKSINRNNETKEHYKFNLYSILLILDNLSKNGITRNDIISLCIIRLHNIFAHESIMNEKNKSNKNDNKDTDDTILYKMDISLSAINNLLKNLVNLNSCNFKLFNRILKGFIFKYNLMKTNVNRIYECLTLKQTFDNFIEKFYRSEFAQDKSKKSKFILFRKNVEESYSLLLPFLLSEIKHSNLNFEIYFKLIRSCKMSYIRYKSNLKILLEIYLIGLELGINKFVFKETNVENENINEKKNTSELKKDNEKDDINVNKNNLDFNKFETYIIIGLELFYFDFMQSTIMDRLLKINEKIKSENLKGIELINIDKFQTIGMNLKMEFKSKYNQNPNKETIKNDVNTPMNTNLETEIKLNNENKSNKNRKSNNKSSYDNKNEIDLMNNNDNTKSKKNNELNPKNENKKIRNFKGKIVEKANNNDNNNENEKLLNKKNGNHHINNSYKQSKKSKNPDKSSNSYDNYLKEELNKNI